MDQITREILTLTLNLAQTSVSSCQGCGCGYLQARVRFVALESVLVVRRRQMEQTQVLALRMCSTARNFSAHPHAAPH